MFLLQGGKWPGSGAETTFKELATPIWSLSLKISSSKYSLKKLDIPGPFHTWSDYDERLCQAGQAPEAEQLAQPEIVHRLEQWTIFLFRISDKESLL